MPDVEKNATSGNIEIKETDADGSVREKEVRTAGDRRAEPRDPSQEQHKDEIIDKEGGSERVKHVSESGKDRSHSKHAKARTEPRESFEEAVEESSQREKIMPSSILEKGIIYFFTRNRVGVDDAESISDLQRTYFVLRPLPMGAELGNGAIEDLQNNRLLALPKKKFLKSHRDRFMAFVEKANTTVQDLKENFLQGSDYTTQTAGARHNQPVTPVGEGVYTITCTDASTHLAYMLTIPSKLGEVQEELGLRSRGGFVVSVKNPEKPGPASARLPQKPDFPKGILQEFRGLAWVKMLPEYSNYVNAHILLIGEGTEGSVGKALEPTLEDQKNQKETPMAVMEKLEHEDELRVQHLHGDDSVFDDLKISKDYPKVLTA